MALAFQDPGLLWLGAVAAVPVIAHLVSRTRPPEKRFPTVEFLRRAMRRVWRWRKPQDWLLLILRTLALAVLALAFARPVWLSGRDWAGVSESKHLILVVDRTGSMAASSGGQTRFSQAKARAVEALRGAGRIDTVNLIWLDAAPDAVYPRMGRALGPLESALRDALATGEAGDAAVALRLALDRLAGVEGRKELIVVSDFQSGSWGGSLPAIPSDVTLVTVPVGEPAGNVSLAAIEAFPVAPLAGETMQVHGRVHNFSGERRTVKVSVTVGEQRLVRDLEVEPWGEGQWMVEPSAPEGEGEFLVRAALEGVEDSLRADDFRWLALWGREALKVGLALPPETVTDGERELWERLLRSLSWAREVGDAGEADILVAAGDGDDTRSAAEAVLARGGGVIFRPTAGASRLGGPFDSLPISGGQWEARNGSENGWRLAVAEEDSPLFHLFALGDYGDPAGGTARERWRPEPPVSGVPVPGGWTLLMAYEDQVPALWRGNRGEGSLWWWNLPMDPTRSTWLQQPAFLPLVGETLLMSRPPEPAIAHANVAPGQEARWVPSRFPEGGGVVLLNGEGGMVPVSEDAASGALAYRTESGLQPGAYRWALREAALDRDVVMAITVVNFPESEMDGRPVDPGFLEQWIQPGASSGLAGRPDWLALREGLPLWPWCLAVGLGFLGVEALVLWMGQRRASPMAAILRTGNA